MHSHRNMEIITVVLKGSLLHQDSMGFKEHIVPGEVQMMSAGTGVNHSEWNDSKDTEVELLQLWVMPNVFDKTPSYSSLKYSEEDLENKLFLIAGPELENKNLQIKQDTKLYLAKIKKGQSITLTSSYEKNEDFLFVIEGNIRIGNENIEKRDAYFKFDSTPEKIQATEDSFILFANSKA